MIELADRLDRILQFLIIGQPAAHLPPEGVVVVGIPSAQWGEVIVAVSEGDGDLTSAVAEATKDLARYKQPRACLTIEKIPRSLQGKVQRARVRELVLARYAMTDGPYPKFTPR